MHASGHWHVHQQNGYNPTWELRQDGKRLSGTAALNNDEGVRAGYKGAVTQALQGEFEGGHVTVRIAWPAKRDGSHSIGIYEGHLRDNRIEGHCHDEADPSHARYTWYAERR